MIKEFEIKIDTGYYKNYFFKEDNKLAITNNAYELSIYPVKIELRTCKDKESNQTGDLIATVLGYYFDMNFMLNEGIPLFDIFDGESQETYELYEALFKNHEYKENLNVFNPNLFYLYDIFVEDDYRQEGYCTLLINQLDEILQYVAKLNVGVIATKIYEFESIDKIDSIEHLTKKEKLELNKKLKNIFINNNYECLENNNDNLVKVIY